MTLLSVPDMTCGHCKASVAAALEPLAGVQSVMVDLTKREVVVTGTATDTALLTTLDEIGFPAAVIAAE